jgi:hypothetical protein
MIDIDSINQTRPAAFTKTMPSQTPVAPSCKTIQCQYDNRFLNARCHCVLGSPPIHINHAVATILVTLVSADHQIPIMPRHC